MFVLAVSPLALASTNQSSGGIFSKGSDILSCIILNIILSTKSLKEFHQSLQLAALEKGIPGSLRLTLFTNGTLITEDLAGWLSQIPPAAVDITLYGASEATYSNLCGSGEAFQKVLGGLELLVYVRLVFGGSVAPLRQVDRQCPNSEPKWPNQVIRRQDL